MYFGKELDAQTTESYLQLASSAFIIDDCALDD
ncbi:hypothetical protein HK44_016020 [Pseudomonas fluorescens HK44]|uniref:Uncharacterized protein n=1 Tax=Pseudomonas fluorescens HK44 TaxID=1042209 RepID=A0A010SV51_PSEFL|nr:hypothetical protein HK44_016020 [Pseudomonas fluorescens HK44]